MVIRRAPAASPVETGNLAVFNNREVFEVSSIQASTSGDLTTESLVTETVTCTAVDTVSLNLLEYIADATSATNPLKYPPYASLSIVISSYGGSWLSPPGIAGELQVQAYAIVTHFPSSRTPASDFSRRVSDIWLFSETGFLVGDLPSSSTGYININVIGYLGNNTTIGYDTPQNILTTTLRTAESGTDVAILLLPSEATYGTLRLNFNNANLVNTTLTIPPGSYAIKALIGGP